MLVTLRHCVICFVHCVNTFKSNTSRFCMLCFSNGNSANMLSPNTPIEMDVTIRAKAFTWDPKSNAYILKIDGARILKKENNHSSSRFVVLEIPPNKIHRSSQTQLLHEADVELIMNEHIYSESHGREYSQSLSYSQRQQIKESHLREESKQQIPTIQETVNHLQYNTMDSLKSIPPIPNSGNRGGNKSYNKYRDGNVQKNDRKYVS